MLRFLIDFYLKPAVLLPLHSLQMLELAFVVVVLIGGALWGVAGMFLSIPITAILKVIFDKIPHLKPLGFLIGDTMPPIGKAIFDFREIQARLSPKKKIKKPKVEVKDPKVA